MATNEFRFSLHLLKRSSQPLRKHQESVPEGDVTVYVPDQTTLVLIVNKIESVARPGFLDMFDVLL
jgi:hypothetical protein